MWRLYSLKKVPCGAQGRTVIRRISNGLSLEFKSVLFLMERDGSSGRWRLYSIVKHCPNFLKRKNGLRAVSVRSGEKSQCRLWDATMEENGVQAAAGDRSDVGEVKP